MMKYTNTTKAVIRVWVHCMMHPFRPIQNILEGSKYIADAIDKDAEKELELRGCELEDINK